MTSSTAELLADLVAIDSTNVALIAGGAGEPELAAHVPPGGAKRVFRSPCARRRPVVRA